MPPIPCRPRRPAMLDFAACAPLVCTRACIQNHAFCIIAPLPGALPRPEEEPQLALGQKKCLVSLVVFRLATRHFFMPCVQNMILYGRASGAAPRCCAALGGGYSLPQSILSSFFHFPLDTQTQLCYTVFGATRGLLAAILSQKGRYTQVYRPFCDIFYTARVAQSPRPS